MSAAASAILLLATLGSGLMAGLFCAFSNFVMRALAGLPAPAGIAAMQAINRVILNPLFYSVFFGTALLCLVLVAAGAAGMEGVSGWAVFGSAVYVVGCFGVTAAFNVPLNNHLAAVDPNADEGAQLWADYLTRWTWWNHVRSLATLVSTAALIFACQNS